MTERVHETWDSPKSTLVFSGEGEDKGTLGFEITNCADPADAWSTLLGGNGVDFSGVPGMVDGMVLRTIDMDPNGPDGWKATCNYSQFKPREREKLANVGDYRISFSAKSTTLKQFVAKNTVKYPSASAPDFGGAINVNRDGQVEGVEVVVPALSITVTQKMAGSVLSPGYAQTVANLIGKYNNASFLGFPAGSIQFVAGDGSLSYEIPSPLPGGTPMAAPDRDLAFEFLYSPNITGLTIGDITGINKLGHQYMWILWKDVLESGIVTQKPRAVYVQDLHGVEPASFAPLALAL